jgi:hypothetical protein
VIAAEVVRHGFCRLALGHIAALAGVGRSTVKRALREAHGLGLIRIEERRLSAWRNDTNVITILLDPGQRRGEIQEERAMPSARSPICCGSAMGWAGLRP